MINWTDALPYLAAAGAVAWGEFRLREYKSENAVLQRKIADEQIEKKDHALTPDQLTSMLESELGPVKREPKT
jgi:hypothetical protein